MLSFLLYDPDLILPVCLHIVGNVFIFSGDLLQHFLTVIFNKLDKGETWDDDFELNTILQVHSCLYFSKYHYLCFPKFSLSSCGPSCLHNLKLPNSILMVRISNSKNAT